MLIAEAIVYRIIPRKDFIDGVTDVLPVLPGFVPFGMVTGVTLVNVGIPPTEAVIMNAVVFAGAAELAIAELLRQETSLAVIVFTALVVNMRFMMLSASLAPHLQDRSTWLRGILGFFLSTPGYVLSIAKFDADPEVSRTWYYLGASLPMWATWQASFIGGVSLGPLVPNSLALDFLFPLIFIALLVKVLKGRDTVAAAITAGLGSIAGTALPFNLGLPTAVLLGVSAGVIVKWRWLA